MEPRKRFKPPILKGKSEVSRKLDSISPPRGLPPIQFTDTSKAPSLFKPDVKLDASMVTDRRAETRRAFVRGRQAAATRILNPKTRY